MVKLENIMIEIKYFSMVLFVTVNLTAQRVINVSKDVVNFKKDGVIYLTKLNIKAEPTAATERLNYERFW